MYEDVEADFWKEIFIHLQHKNMMRMGTSDFDNAGCQNGLVNLRFSEKLSVDNAQEQFDIFHRRNTKIMPEISGSSSYFTWEVFVTSTIKLRLFIQNQIKCSLMQNINGDFTKIADAKFPNNPFPEIEEFLSNRDKYLKELGELTYNTIRSKKQQKITLEIIKALLMKKFKNTDVIWYLETKGNDFLLTIDNKNGNKKDIIITMKDFVNEIDNL